MPPSNYPYGITSYGIPLLGHTGIPMSVPKQTYIGLNDGRVWFVDPTQGAANDGNEGTPKYPLRTIARAHTLARAGDTILAFAGTYDETITITKDYITLMGCQHAGYARPDIGPSVAGYPLVVQAQGFRAYNCRFVGNTLDCVVQRGNGFHYENCVFDGDGSLLMSGVWLVGAAADDAFTASEGLIVNNLFRGNSVGIELDTAAPPLNGVGCTDDFILFNKFVGNTMDIITLNTGATATYSAQNILIAHNFFADKNKATYIDFTTANAGGAAAQTGCIAGNYFATDAFVAGVTVAIVGTGFAGPGNFSNVGVADFSVLD